MWQLSSEARGGGLEGGAGSRVLESQIDRPACAPGAQD